MAIKQAFAKSLNRLRSNRLFGDGITNQAAPAAVLNQAPPAAIKMKGITLDHRSIYMDYQSTTPLDPRVLDTMMFLQTEQYGNPHSRTHMYGWETEDMVEEAREKVAKLINANPKEIIFTSGATESNNCAVKGVANFYKDKKHIITVQTEHKCVLDSCRQLELKGYDVTYLGVKADGLIDLEELRSKLRPDTSLVSVMHVNNEIGVIQNIKAIGEMCRKNKTFFHTDAAQSLGKIPIDVNEMNIDLMSMSAHKIYGPKGIGALYVRRRPRVRIEPIINGGGQERGLRSGTLPAPLCVGFGRACEIAEDCMEEDYEHVKRLSDKYSNEVCSQLEGVYQNGSGVHRYPGNINYSFECVEGESLLMALSRVAVSSGSACTSASLEPSYVLKAIGVGDYLAHTSLRIGFGRFTTDEEVDFAIRETVSEVKKLRDLSPLWEMKMEGVDVSQIHWGS